MARFNRRNVEEIDSSYMDHYHMKVERMKRRKKRFIRRFVLVSLVMIAAFAFLFSYHLNQRAIYHATVEKHDKLVDEMDHLIQAENALLEEIELLKDDDYILDIARSSYFLSKKGEIIFQIDKDS